MAKKRSDYWECPKCGHMSHFSSDVCTYPSCLAAYWRRQAENHHEKAARCIESAKSLEKQAQDIEQRSSAGEGVR